MRYNPRIEISDDILTDMVAMRRAGKSYTDIGARHGIHRRTVQRRIEDEIGVTCFDKPGAKIGDDTRKIVDWLRENHATHTFDEAVRLLQITEKRLWYLEARYGLRCQRTECTPRSAPRTTIWPLEGFNALASAFIRGQM